jgi:hypothetical protein
VMWSAHHCRVGYGGSKSASEGGFWTASDVLLCCSVRTATTPPNTTSIASSTKWRIRGTLHWFVSLQSSLPLSQWWRGGAGGWQLSPSLEYLCPSEMRRWSFRVWASPRVHQRRPWRSWRPTTSSSAETELRPKPKRWTRSSRLFGPGSREDARPPPMSHRCVGINCFL